MGYEDFIYKEPKSEQDTAEQTALFNELARQVSKRLPIEEFHKLDTDRTQMVLMGPGLDEAGNEQVVAKGLIVVGMVALSMFVQARVQRYMEDHGHAPTAMALDIDMVFTHEPPPGRG